MCVYRLLNFLSEDEQQLLLQTVSEAATARRFHFSVTTTNQENYRKSLVLYEFDFQDQFLAYINGVLPTVENALGIDLGSIFDFECQLTAHGDGGFYGVHRDNDGGVTTKRTLTYVYYFSLIPRRFQGGELWIYPDPDSPDHVTVDPVPNSIVFFDSSLFHEVRPVHCPSDLIMDSRFTVNGWLSRRGE